MDIIEFIEKRDSALRSMVEIVSDIDTAIADGIIEKGREDENGRFRSPFKTTYNVTDELIQAYLDGCKSIGVLAETTVTEMKKRNTVYTAILDNILFKENCYSLDPSREIVDLFKRIAAQRMRELYQNDGVTLRVTYAIEFDRIKAEYPKVSDNDLIEISLSNSRVQVLLRYGDLFVEKDSSIEEVISIFLLGFTEDSIIGNVAGESSPIWRENERVIDFTIDFDSFDYFTLKEKYHKSGNHFDIFNATVVGVQGARAIAPLHYIKGMIWATSFELINPKTL